MAFPSDKDQYAITDKVIRQTDCQYSFGKAAVTLSLKFMGTASDAVALSASFREGTRVTLSDVKAKFGELSGLDAGTIRSSGKVTSSQAVTRQEGAVATVTVSIPYKKKLYPEQDKPEESKVVVWTEKSTDYEFPIDVYAGESSGSQADAGAYAAWKNEKEEDIALYKDFKVKVNGTVTDLSGRTLELAKKAYRGVETVRRAYPEVVRTTQYYNLEADEDEVDASLLGQIDETPDLYHIDATPDDVWGGKFPNFSWLKSSYDVDPQPTEYEKLWNVTVTETWIGIDPAERGPWDSNLYGDDPDRWPFAQQGGSNGQP